MTMMFKGYRTKVYVLVKLGCTLGEIFIMYLMHCMFGPPFHMFSLVNAEVSYKWYSMGGGFVVGRF